VSAKEIAALRGHGKAVNFAAFSPDGTRIVTASWDETARIWDTHFATMSTQDLMREVCTWLGPGLTTLTPDEMRLAAYTETRSRLTSAQTSGDRNKRAITRPLSPPLTAPKLSNAPQITFRPEPARDPVRNRNWWRSVRR
jgi:WD domain, G-beta repeat